MVAGEGPPAPASSLPRSGAALCWRQLRAGAVLSPTDPTGPTDRLVWPARAWDEPGTATTSCGHCWHSRSVPGAAAWGGQKQCPRQLPRLLWPSTALVRCGTPSGHQPRCQRGRGASLVGTWAHAGRGFPCGRGSCPGQLRQPLAAGQEGFWLPCFGGEAESAGTGVQHGQGAGRHSPRAGQP